MATFSSHRLIMGKEEIDNFFCLIGDIWNFFLQKCLLSSPLLGGALSRKIYKFNTFLFRKDKFGISLKVIICTFLIRVLWGCKPGPTGQIKGR